MKDVRTNSIITTGLIEKLGWENTLGDWNDMPIYRDQEGNKYMLKEITPEIYKVMVKYNSEGLKDDKY